MNTLEYLEAHVYDVKKVGYGAFSATVTFYGKRQTVTFHDSEVYDRIRYDHPYIPTWMKGTGGYTLRQALEHIYQTARDRRK